MINYLALLLSAVLVTVDQLLKLVALKYLQPLDTYPIIEDIFHFTYVENRGAAFGMMEGQQWLLVWGTALVLLIGIVAIMMGKVKKRTPLFILSIIIGGGIGNLIDRIYRGFVVDYIHVKAVQFAVFNFADICITVGTAALVCYLLFSEVKLAKDKPKKEKN